MARAQKRGIVTVVAFPASIVDWVLVRARLHGPAYALSVFILGMPKPATPGYAIDWDKVFMRCCSGCNASPVITSPFDS
jgi:hypothetical protein